MIRKLGFKCRLLTLEFLRKCSWGESGQTLLSHSAELRKLTYGNRLWDSADLCLV